MSRAPPELIQPGETVDNRWRMIKKLGQGGFGAVYLVFDNQIKAEAALKIERMEEVHLLKMELIVLEELNKARARHVTKLLGKGRQPDYTYIVMGLVGPNLEKLTKEAGGKFSVGSATRVTKQCIESIQDIHQIGYLHRDIKPGNYARGKSGDEIRVIIMLDYGMARKYTKDNGQHKTPRCAAGFRGTPRYASPQMHKDQDLGRIDDLWSLFYMMVEYTAGGLPWKRMEDKDDIGRCKDRTSINELLQGCPREYREFHDMLTSCTYYDEPDYQGMTNVMKKIEKKAGVREDDAYDWE